MAFRMSTAALRGLAPITNAEQLSRLMVLDGWLAVMIVEQLRSWLTWKPLSYPLLEVLWFIETAAWFPEGQRQWARFLLTLPTPRVSSALYQQRWDQELDQRSYFQVRYLLHYPPEVANLTCHEYIHEAYRTARPALGWVFLVSLLLVIEDILAHPDLRARRHLPLQELARWARGLLRIG